MSEVRVAIVGAGEVGRGWAALCVAAGWPVTIYDKDSAASNSAPEEVASRARSLVNLDRAISDTVEQGISRLEMSGSLLRCTREAQWIIEAIDEDLRHKQKLMEALEETSVRARAVTSSTTAFSPAEIASRCRNRARVMVAHPLNPPELIPLVEMVPGPETDPMLVELMKGWLHALGRIAIVVKKSVPGHVTGRIAAAVWREAIDLVLNDVIDIDDLDRAVSLGPALQWAAAGPHLSYHLAAGSGGVEAFFQMLLASFEKKWEDLADWSKLEPDQRKKITHAIEHTYADKLELIRNARDRRLAAMLRSLERARRS